MEIHKYQVSPSQVTLEESASKVTEPGHDQFLDAERKTREEEKLTNCLMTAGGRRDRFVKS